MKTTFPSIIAALSVLSVVLATTSALATTIAVTSTADSGSGTLRSALASATNGDTIDARGLSGTILLTTGELVVSNSVTILGPGPRNLAVNGNYPSTTNRLFYINSGLNVTVAGLTLTNGNAPDGGGAIYNYRSTLTLSNCTLSGNAADLAGAILNDGQSGSARLTIVSSTLSGNSAETGGAIRNDGTYSGNAKLAITNSTFSGNSAGIGAIANDGYKSGNATLIIVNSTFSANSSIEPGTAGSIQNSDDFGGSAKLAIGGTILNAGASGVNIAGGTVTSLGYNLSSDNGAGLLIATGDQINTDPMLGPLQLNGGQTPTHALLSGSPAVDAGTNFSGLATDQRGPGFPRTVDINGIPNVAGGTDIGAFELPASEFHPQPPAITSTNSVTFITGYSNSFRIVATGAPGPAIYATGILPAGISLTTNGLLSGTVPPGPGGIYPLTVIASNGVSPMATQYLTLTVVEAAARPSFNTSGLGWVLNGDTVNGGPKIIDNVFTLTDGTSDENRSGWFAFPLYVGAFEASFTYQDVGGDGADGVAFVIQNDPRGTTALGLAGGGLAYAGITNSVALLLNIYSGAPGGPSGWMLGTNGVGAYDGSGALSGRSYQSTAPVNLDLGNPIAVALRYTGGILHVSLTDTVTSANFQTNIPVNVPAFTGSDVAWVGITGSDGDIGSHQTVSNFSYVPLPTLAISSQPGSVVFTWPATVYGFELQSNANLNNMGGWQSVGATVTQTNNLNQVIIPSPTGAQFYRLVLP